MYVDLLNRFEELKSEKISRYKIPGSSAKLSNNVKIFTLSSVGLTWILVDAH